jgi:hypothetical protein
MLQKVHYTLYSIENPFSMLCQLIKMLANHIIVMLSRET